MIMSSYFCMFCPHPLLLLFLFCHKCVRCFKVLFFSLSPFIFSSLYVQYFLGCAAAAQPVAPRPPADGGIPQSREEDLDGHGLPDEPGHGVVQLGKRRRAALRNDKHKASVMRTGQRLSPLPVLTCRTTRLSHFQLKWDL